MSSCLFSFRTAFRSVIGSDDGFFNFAVFRSSFPFRAILFEIAKCYDIGVKANCNNITLGGNNYAYLSV